MNGKQNTGEQLREMARLFGGSMPSRQTLLGALRRMGRYDSPATDTELEQLLAAGISADKERIKQLVARNAELVDVLTTARNHVYWLGSTETLKRIDAALQQEATQ